MGSNSVRANFSLTERVDRILNEKSNEWDMSRSEIVRKAVLEYTDEDRTARIEDKLDRLLEQSDEGGPPASLETRPEKEKASNSGKTGDESLPADLLAVDTSSPTENRANKMFNYIINEFHDIPLVGKQEIQDAIEEIWSDTEYAMEQYEPKIHSRLEDAGIEKHPTRDVWYFDRDVFVKHVQAQWADVEKTLREGEPPKDSWDVDGENDLDWIREAMSRADEMKQMVIDEGIESEGEVQDVYEDGLEQLDQSRWG